MNQKKQAAFMVIRYGDDLVSIASKNGIGFNPPGGKVEPGETSRDACVREVFEETGVIVHACEYLCEDEADGYEVTGYVATRWEGKPYTKETREVGIVKKGMWLIGDYAEFHKKTFEALRRRESRLNCVGIVSECESCALSTEVIFSNYYSFGTATMVSGYLDGTSIQYVNPKKPKDGGSLLGRCVSCGGHFRSWPFEREQ